MSEITERSGSMRRQSSFTKSVSSLFKKKKKSSAGDASKEVSSRAETPQATPRGEERAAAPANTSAAAPAPEPAVEPAYASNYAADKPEAAAPAAPEPAAEPTQAPDPTPEPAAPEPAAPEPAAPEPAAPEPEPPAPEPPAPEPPATAAPEPVPEPTTDPEPAASEPVAPEPEPPAPAEETVPAPPALSEEQASGAPTSAEGEAQTPLEPGWEEVQADDGRVYYWKEETDETTWTKPSSRRGSAVEAAAAAYTAAAAGAKEGSEGGDTGRERKPSVHDRMSQFERGCDNSEAATAASGAKRQSGTESVVKQLQKAGIQDDPKAVPASTAPSQHKLALASFERKAEKLAGGGPGHGGGSGSQMSDALKGLQAAREKPDGPSQHSVAMDRLKRQAEQPSVVRRAEPTPETDGTEGAGGMAAAKAALFQKKQEADGPKMSMKEEAMRKLNGKGVVKTSEAFHTKSARGTQHNAALSAFQGMQGVDVTTGGPKKSELRRNTAPPRPNNKAAGIGADGGPSQRAAAMAAFQNVAGGDVAASK